ncbi:MAG: 2Fe-2S iron-sulfur cluster-binding protein [Candidatus Micrarchaeota archaeon]
MAKVRLKNDGIEVEVPDGSMVLDYLKDTNLPRGCEEGECGVCVCSVSKGTENTERKTQKEETTLARIGAYPSQRLACQLKIKKGEIEVEY